MRRALTAMVAAAVLAGCSGGTTDEAASTTPATEAGVTAALGFSAPLIDGSELDVRTLAGRPVVFWFWSPY